MRSAFNSIISLILILGFSKLNYSQPREISISGFVSDKITGDNLIGTNILIYKDTLKINSELIYGTATNNFGYYIIPKLKRENFFIIFRHLGYKISICEVDLKEQVINLNYNIQLEPENIKLNEVIVEGKRIDKNVLSTIDISPELLAKLPSMSGEVDLFRLFQFLPGINKASELSNGLYVRGGSPDQTLTLVDGSVIYNPSHIGNISSTFNSNAIHNVKLIKGSFPAEYGGRLSSVLDIKLRSGTKEREKGTIGIGVINSFFNFEGPLEKSSTYMVAGRIMYYDRIQNKLNKNSTVPRYTFHDFNGKLNYNLSESSIFSLSAMYSYDKMYNPSVDDIQYKIEWENLNVALNWLQINSKSLLLNSSLSFSKYNFSSKVGISTNTISSSAYFTNPDLTDLIFKQTAEVNWEMNQKLKTGFEISFHNYDLLYNEYYDRSYEQDPYAGKNINAIEAALFFQNESIFFYSLKTNLGGRLIYFKDINKLNFEPRISLSFELLDGFYVKSAASIVNQYLHLITRNDIALPNDLWYPATPNLQPSRSTEFVFGLDKYFDSESYQASAEIYYRDMKNILEFKTSPEINPLNNSIEDQFISGVGEAYGMELFVQKREGDLIGWIGYTLSWTKRQFDELNLGKVFYPKYDRRNDLSLAATYNFSDEVSIGATFTYATGMRYNAPSGQFVFNPIGVSGNSQILFNYEDFNTYKFPPYHKLDLNFNYKICYDKTELKFYINLYNVYDRRNAYAQFLNISKDENGNRTIKLKRISLFPFIPSAGISISF